MKVMVITGASRGIGAATARAAARNGYVVVVNFNQSRAPAEGLVAEIIQQGGKALAIRADVSRSDEAAHLFEEVDRLAGTPSVLVNNAGIIGGTVPIGEMSEETVTKAFAANVFSSFYCSREAVARMSTERGGRGGAIINMSSAAARHGGVPNETHYASSKGAIDSFTVSLAKEVGKHSIRVNALRPGLIDTSIHESHGGKAAVDALAPSIPIGRAGTADEVAEAVLWLASDASSYVHGAILDVSGGR